MSSELYPSLCEECFLKYRELLPLTVEIKFVFSNVIDGGWHTAKGFCIHKFREIKFTETNLELLERKYEEGLDK